MTDSAISPSWRERERPLEPEALLVSGPGRRALLDRLRGDGDLERLRLVDGGGVLVLLGPRLPWVDGGVWLGRDGPLMVPTRLAPDLPVTLLARALARESPSATLRVLGPDVAVVAPMPTRPPGRSEVDALLAGEPCP